MPFKDELEQIITRIKQKVSDNFGENPLGFSVTVKEGFGAIITGYRGVSYVSEDEIRFRVSKTFVTIFGKNLIIVDINEGEAIVSGTVTRFEVGQ